MQYYANYNLSKVQDSIKEAAKYFWSRREVLYNFTDHTLKHSERIIEIAKHIASHLSIYEKLSELELFGIHAAAYLHDIGMQWNYFISDKDIKKERYETARIAHVTRGIRLVEHIVGKLVINDNNFTCNQILHGFGNPEGDYDRLLLLFLPLIAAHSRDDNGKESGWEKLLGSQDLLISGSPYRVKLLGAIFRLADELDMTYRRVPDYDRLNRVSLSPLALAHWATCDLIEEIYVNKGTIKFVVNNGKIPKDKKYNDVCSVLLFQLMDKIKSSYVQPIAGFEGKKNSIEQILLSYGINIKLVEDYEYKGSTIRYANTAVLDKIIKHIEKGNMRFGEVYQYKIRGAKRIPSSNRKKSVRKIYLVDERNLTWIPDFSKSRFVMDFFEKNNLERERAAIGFLHNVKNDSNHLNYHLMSENSHNFGITGFTSYGVERNYPFSICLAAVSHLKKIERADIVVCGYDKYCKNMGSCMIKDNEYSDDLINFSVDYNDKNKPLVEDKASKNVKISYHSGGWHYFLLKSPINAACIDDDAIVGFFKDVYGLHIIIPSWVNALPEIRDFFEDTPNIKKSFLRSRYWKRRFTIIKQIAKTVITDLKVLNPLTISIIGLNGTFQVLTYSFQNQTVLSFSGGAILSAALLLLELPDILDGSPTEIKYKKNEIDICPWYNPNEFFIIRKEQYKCSLFAKVKLSDIIKVKN